LPDNQDTRMMTSRFHDKVMQVRSPRSRTSS
jgi:hypothetical protein